MSCVVELDTDSILGPIECSTLILKCHPGIVVDIGNVIVTNRIYITCRGKIILYIKNAHLNCITDTWFSKCVLKPLDIYNNLIYKPEKHRSPNHIIHLITNKSYFDNPRLYYKLLTEIDDFFVFTINRMSYFINFDTIDIIEEVDLIAERISGKYSMII